MFFPANLAHLTVFCCAWFALPAWADAQTKAAKPAQAAQAGPGQSVPVRSANPKSKEPGKPGKPDAEPSSQGNADTKGAAGDTPKPKVIRRGDRPAAEANPEELKASVGADGKVAFQFRNQPWVELVQWLAEIADQPLDWQELPADRVNLRSPGRYTVEQTKDLFNRHLLARGYTLLEMPGGITVAKTDNVNPAMVPRVSVEELTELMPHQFVRTSLDPGWLSSEKLAEELKPMISSNGRLTALTTTNRIEAMDAAINLRQVAWLLQQERDQSSRESLAPEFKLRHISAETAKRMLEQFLGVEKKSSAPMTPQQIQMMQRMAQQNRNNAPPPKKEPEISIVADTRQNSIYVRAPVDRIAIAGEFIKRIDVPGQGLTSLADVESRVQVVRLYSIDPEKLIEIIGEMNVLEPSTRIRADQDNHALIVSGSAADRYIIERLVKRLDGSGRKFEVLQLRRLDATEVAESIAFLMGKDQDKEDDNRSRRYYYYGFGGNDSEDDSQQDEFRVAANERYRQVLLWANESEMEQVQSLLVKLGELPPPGGSRSMIRRIEASATPETYEYLQQLESQWRQISDAPLAIPDRSEFSDPTAAESDEAAKPESESETNPSDAPQPDAGTATKAGPDLESTKRAAAAREPLAAVNTPHPAASANVGRLTAARSAQAMPDAGDQAGTQTQAKDARSERPGSGDAPPGTAAAAEVNSAVEFDRLFGGPTATTPGSDASRDQADRPAAPITIQLDREGNLVLSGRDPRMLDRLENLMLRVAPPRRPYHVFKIKHQSAYYIQLNLEEYFADQDANDDSSSDSFYRYLFGRGDEQDDGPAGLGARNELRFVQDPDTNTIVVSGATSSQLKTIKELISLWDVAEPSNKRRMRYTKLVTLEYGDAESIAETVKEAYRDLLSSNDKTFTQNGRRGGGGGTAQGNKSSGREQRGSGLVDSENGRDGGDVDFSFKGKLSLGIDKVGNTLLVSAEGEPLLELVVEMIHKLDMAAKPAGDLRILSLSGNTSELSMQTVLKALGKNGDTPTAPTPRPQAPRPPEAQTP